MVDYYKIGLVINELRIGGAERLLVELVSAWLKQYQPFQVFVYAFDDGPIREELEDLGVVVKLPPKGGRINPLLIAWLKKCLRDDRINLIHAHLPRAGFYARLSAQLLHLPIVYTEHSLWEKFNFVSRFLNARTFFLNEFAATVSQAVGLSIRKSINFPASRLFCIYNGVEPNTPRLSRVKARQVLDLSEEAIVLGSVANLHPRKGHRFLLEALSQLRKGIPELCCVLIGRDCGVEADLRRQASELGVDPAIRWAGYRPDARQLLPAFDLFVLPSLYEGLPMCLIEAMDAGLPVVATRVGGTPEVVEDGQTGLLVEAGDSLSLSAAILSLLRDPEKGRKMGEVGRRRMLREFTIDRMAQRYAELYFQLLF